MKRALALLCALTLLPASAVAAGIPQHIPTWAFDQHWAEGKDATPAQVRRYLTYAYSGLGNDKALVDCRGSNACSSVFYFDPGFIYDSAACPFSGDKDFLAVAQESWFVHFPGYTDSSHRVHGTYTQNCKGTQVQVPVYAVNQTNPAVARYYRQALQRAGDNYDFYMMDDTASTLVEQLYGPGGAFCKGAFTLNGYCTSTQEMASDRDVTRSHVSLAAQLRHRDGTPMKFFYNGVSFGPDGPRIDLLRQYNRQIVGALCENCVVNDGTLRANMYAKVLDAMAAIDQIKGASFVEQNTGKSPPGSDEQISQRLVTTAMAWLGFDGDHVVVFPNLEFNTTNLAVWPENDIYPTQPLESMRSGNGDLSVAPSVWRREFSKCYLHGTPIGPCAAVVNGSSGSVTPSPGWFRLRFQHAVSLSGGDALNGGTVRLNGSSATSAILPGQAALLVR